VDINIYNGCNGLLEALMRWYYFSMNDYRWRPQGLTIREEAITVHPLIAFEKFVVPGLGVPAWVEDSSNVTDTGMSKREWAGLVVHAFSLMSLTGDRLVVGKDFDGGDGVIVRENSNGYVDGVHVEQTLVTHKRHTDLEQGIKAELAKKSAKQYPNTHLIIWCNIEGNFDPPAIAQIVSGGAFNIVDVVGFNSGPRVYQSLLFDKDVLAKPIHSFHVKESDLLPSR
jgi:hypothetical protein